MWAQNYFHKLRNRAFCIIWGAGLDFLLNGNQGQFSCAFHKMHCIYSLKAAPSCNSGFLERRNPWAIYSCMEKDLVWELAHVIMVTERSHALPSANWRMLAHVFQPRPENQEAHSVDLIQVWKAATWGAQCHGQEMHISAWAQKMNPTFSHIVLRQITGHCSIQSTSNAHLFWKPPLRHNKKQCFASYLDIL